MPPDANLATAATHQSAALAARYGAAIPPSGPWNATIDLLLSHRSVRSYLTTPVPEGTAETLVAAAQSAASSSNMQVWSVVAVRDPARRARLAVLAGNQRHIGVAPLFLVWLADLSRLERLGAAHGQEMGALPFTEAFLLGAVDASLAAQNAVVAAESLGLGTVYIGAMRNKPEEVAAELGLPPGVMAVFGLCVGVPDPADVTEVKPRLPQDVVLHDEQYAATGDAAGIASYDDSLTAFQHSQKMQPVGWSKTMLGRLATPASLGGRDRLRAALAALGFPMR